MKKIVFMFGLLCMSLIIQAQDIVQVKQSQTPILIDRQDNVLLYIRLDAKDSQKLDEITIDIDGDTRLSDIKSLKLYYSGTESAKRKGKILSVSCEYISEKITEFSDF